MSEVLTTIQQQINYQYEQLAYFENLYNQAKTKANINASIYYACIKAKQKNPFYSCRKNLGGTKTELGAIAEKWTQTSWGYLQEIKKIKKEIDRLNLELELYTDQVEDLTDLSVEISNADRVIKDNERNLGIENFKIYAIPLIILALVFFGVYLIRKKGK